jgi:hypothetical protein
MIVQNNLSRSQNKVFHSNNDNDNVTCRCPGAKPGKINLDVSAHEFGCWNRKRLLTKRYTCDTCVTPDKFNDYSLGVTI